MRCTLCDLREEFWRRNGYTSQNCPLEGSSEEEEEEGEEEEEEEERQINYVVGDVTQPQNTGSSDAIIIHCVGECSLVLFTHDRFKPNCERSSHYSWVGGVWSLCELQCTLNHFMWIVLLLQIGASKCVWNQLLFCADDSGRWGRGGLFSALSARSPQPQAHYELAGQMKG